jgi:hypothetical protein
VITVGAMVARGLPAARSSCCSTLQQRIMASQCEALPQISCVDVLSMDLLGALQPRLHGLIDVLVRMHVSRCSGSHANEPSQAAQDAL